MFWGKKRSIFLRQTDFDRGFDTSDNIIREFGPVVDQHISDAFDDKTSDYECSVMGDNSAGKYTGLILYFVLVIILLMLIRTQGQTHPSVYRPGPGGDWKNDDYSQNPEDTAMISPRNCHALFGLSFDIQ